MKCPTCGAWCAVLETRNRQPENRTRRRYECGNLHRFTTLEAVVKYRHKHDNRNTFPVSS